MTFSDNSEFTYLPFIIDRLICSGFSVFTSHGFTIILHLRLLCGYITEDVKMLGCYIIKFYFLPGDISLTTPPRYEYVAVEDSAVNWSENYFLFSVRIPNDAHVALLPSAGSFHDRHLYEIVICGYGCTRSDIR